VVASTLRHFGRLDIVVNNAGISGNSVTDLYSTEGWHRIAINATGVFFGTKHAVKAKLGKGGAIVNMSSINGFVASEGAHMAYHASKGAVRLMTKTIAVQHAKDGIRCNSVHPGTMPLMRTAIRSRDPVVRAEMIKKIPMGRAGEVEEVAKAVLFLASDEASYITGTELVVDGGAIAI
jgi:NAD(P)-dependent dehydrogenase (short-subunit alcohol dehydrogenase family)